MSDTETTPSGQIFDVLRPEDRPQDTNRNGRDLRFETGEHGGAEPDTMPEVVTVTDRAGRWAVYALPLRNDRPVRPRGRDFEAIDPQERLQDESMDGRDLTFKTGDHGPGGVDDLMPGRSL